MPIKTTAKKHGNSNKITVDVNPPGGNQQADVRATYDSSLLSQVGSIVPAPTSSTAGDIRWDNVAISTSGEQFSFMLDCDGTGSSQVVGSVNFLPSGPQESSSAPCTCN